MKPGGPVLQSTRLLDLVRERIRYMHYSLKTEKAYLYWARFFIRWSATQPGGMRHTRDMGVQDVEAFLSMMANERNVSASTHNQAPSAVLFLYREVLGIDLPWLNNIGRPQQSKRILSVLTKDEVAGLLAQMVGINALLAHLLYGTGMRLLEGMRLRVKDGDLNGVR
jgi:site-specific recombinase XerD